MNTIITETCECMSSSKYPKKVYPFVLHYDGKVYCKTFKEANEAMLELREIANKLEENKRCDVPK